MPHRLIQIGTGGRGAVWCSRLLPPLIEDGLIEVAAAMDVAPEALGSVLREYQDG